MKIKSFAAIGSFFIGGLLAGVSSWAQVPECMDHGQALSINNAQVIQWKTTTQNNYTARGHIQGTLQQIYPDQTGHHHLEVRIGQDPADTIEVIYNEDFGSTPAVHIGSQIEACGDYITANQQSGHYPPSPDGALIHWLHRAPRPTHDSGYLVIDGTVCGG